MQRDAEPVHAGIDVGGTTTTIVLVNRDGRVIARRETDTPAGDGYECVLKRISETIQEMLLDASGTGRLVGAGLALPGVLDMDKGVSLFLPNMHGNWPGVPAARILSDSLGVSTYLLNDARAATFGESEFGAGRGVKNLVLLTLGTGIGGGIIVDDHLFFGARGWAGELGHITVEAQGPRCSCGNYGCVEALASGTAISSAAIRSIKQGLPTQMRDMIAGDLNLVTPELVARAAEAGDIIALEIYERAGHYIGTAVASLMTILNPELVIIGGGVAKAGRLILEPINRCAMIRSSIFKEPGGGAKIVPAQLGSDAGAIGAAAWSIRKDPK